MSITTSSKWLYLVSGCFAIPGIPVILFLEDFSWWNESFNDTHFVATVLCFLASIIFLWSTRGSRFSTERLLAVAASVLSGLWLAFIGFMFIGGNAH